MKALLKTCLFTLAISYGIPAMANFQGINDLPGRNKNEVKLYIEASRVHFSDEGIFLKTDSNHLMPIDHLSHDVVGYYLSSSWFRTSHYEASCNGCGYTYQDRSPQPCEGCGRSEGFTIIYLESEDYWDRY